MIEPGTTLARYRVESKLGEGGMGVVWKATDVTLHRAVALKVLPEAFARDPERVARFEREARMLASLNHPNIAAIYGLESDGPLRVLAMEYVPGDTLRERLARGALPVPEALHIALKIAEALESAHERGVVHRDLKPANVAVTPDGDVKLLDFGLARAFAPDGEMATRTDDSPTISAVMTRGDVILGTAAYMSPEQARGKLVDRRSDIWSFGLVLFEMLTGKMVFDGDTTTDLLAAVLRQDIPWERLPRDTPPHVRALLERCLERDPKLRLRDIGEARITLARAPSAAVERRSGMPGWVLPACLIPLAIAATWFLAHRTTPPATDAPMRAFEIASVRDPQRAQPSLSPDGQSIAYIDRGQLWVRELGQIEPRSLVSDANARKPFWSPDGKSIGFVRGQNVMRVPTEGGAVETVAELPGPFGLGGDGVAWNDKGRMIVTQGTPNGLLDVSEHGGEPRTILAPDTTRDGDFHEPSLLPGGRGMLLVAHRKEGTDNISLVRDGKVSRLLVLPNQELACPQYSPTGHIIFERGTPPSGIWAVPFSLATMRTTGEPFLVAARGMSPSVAPDGGLTYVSPPAQELEFCWVDRAGSVVQHLATLGIPMEGGGVFDLSPDGTRAVITMGSAADLWIYDFVRGSRIQLTKNPGLDVNGTLTPDGRSVVYQTFPNLGSPKLSDWTLMRVNADASGAPESLATGGLLTPSISADGRTIYYTHITSETGWTLESRPLEGPGGPVALTDGRQVAYAPRSSPDGRWVVYCQDEIQPSGNSQVVLMSLASGWRTVLGNGLWPKWNERGDRIYFVQRDDIMEVKVGPGETPRTEPPVKLFTRPQIELPMVFDWTPQFSVRGDRFLVLRPQDETRMTSIVFVQNWLSEFRKK